MTPEPLIARLATHLQRPVPEYVRTRARLHLLDWLACVAGALAAPRPAYLGRGHFEIDELKYLGNILEMDDVHRQALLHPGPIVWPAALQASGWSGSSLDEMLDGAIVGYETMIAVGATFDATHYAHFHNTATAGAFGAAAVWCGMGNRSSKPTEMAHALALAGSVTGGLWQLRHEATDAKQFHVYHAAETGAQAALFALRGGRGPLSILEGPQGLYAAMCREPKPMVLGPGWRIEEVSFKPWAACRHAHAAIDCALELRAAGKLTAPFHVETYADAITFCDKPDPQTEGEAKFSIQHAVAVIADGRNATPADFTPDAIAALAPLRAQVTVAEDRAITARYPAHFGARVNGFELQDCRGDPERPVTEADIIAKMHMLAKWGGLPASEADRAVDVALRGDDAGAIVTMLEEWLS
jgi:2-methylcitrate dehydratase PrpD